MYLGALHEDKQIWGPGRIPKRGTAPPADGTRIKDRKRRVGNPLRSWPGNHSVTYLGREAKILPTAEKACAHSNRSCTPLFMPCLAPPSLAAAPNMDETRGKAPQDAVGERAHVDGPRRDPGGMQLTPVDTPQSRRNARLARCAASPLRRHSTATQRASFWTIASAFRPGWQTWSPPCRRQRAGRVGVSSSGQNPRRARSGTSRLPAGSWLPSLHPLTTHVLRPLRVLCLLLWDRAGAKGRPSAVGGASRQDT